MPPARVSMLGDRRECEVAAVDAAGTRERLSGCADLLLLWRVSASKVVFQGDQGLSCRNLSKSQHTLRAACVHPPQFDHRWPSLSSLPGSVLGVKESHLAIRLGHEVPGGWTDKIVDSEQVVSHKVVRFAGESGAPRGHQTAGFLLVWRRFGDKQETQARYSSRTHRTSAENRRAAAR
jgi:hypothetical protein